MMPIEPKVRGEREREEITEQYNDNSTGSDNSAGDSTCNQLKIKTEK